MTAARSVFPENPKVVFATYEDWLVNVLLSDGRFYSFCTEMWPAHGPAREQIHDTNWPAVVREAKAEALELAARGVDTWALDAIPENEQQFVAALNFVCMAASDADFRRFVRH